VWQEVPEKRVSMTELRKRERHIDQGNRRGTNTNSRSMGSAPGYGRGLARIGITGRKKKKKHQKKTTDELAQASRTI